MEIKGTGQGVARIGDGIKGTGQGVAKLGDENKRDRARSGQTKIEIKMDRARSGQTRRWNKEVKTMVRLEQTKLRGPNSGVYCE
jgi:hypothetical protein